MHAQRCTHANTHMHTHTHARTHTFSNKNQQHLPVLSSSSTRSLQSTVEKLQTKPPSAVQSCEQAPMMTREGVVLQLFKLVCCENPIIVKVLDYHRTVHHL